MKKICIAISFIFVLSLSATGCGSNKSTTAEKKEATEPIIESVEEQEPIVVVLNSVSTTEEDEWDELDEGKELLVLDVSVTNHLAEDYSFNPNYFMLQANGETIRESSKNPKEEDTLHAYKVAPEETLSGIVCFDIDKGTTDYRIFYSDFDGTELELSLD